MSNTCSATHSDKAVFLQLGWLGWAPQVTVLVYKTLNITDCIDLIYTELNLLHSLKISWSSVGEYPTRYICEPISGLL